MEAAIPLSGQVAGRIDSVRPVAEILAEIVNTNPVFTKPQKSAPPQGSS